MPLRRRIAYVAGAAVGIAIVLVAVTSYIVVRGQLRGSVDDALRAQLAAVQHGDHLLDQAPPGIPASAGGPAQYVQYADASGQTYSRQGDLLLPVTSIARSIAASGSGTYMADVHVGNNHLRELIFPALLVSQDGSEL